MREIEGVRGMGIRERVGKDYNWTKRDLKVIGNIRPREGSSGY